MVQVLTIITGKNGTTFFCYKGKWGHPTLATSICLKNTKTGSEARLKNLWRSQYFCQEYAYF